MPEYQKVLQLYRSTNIWDTKNIAKAQIEIHAKQLHSEVTPSLKDGEPIVGKYYDKADGYVFKFVEIESENPDPFSGGYSAHHHWVDGYDSFSDNEFNPATGEIKGKEPDYDSPAYIRVGSNDRWTYYRLDVRTQQDPEPERCVSAVFGVVLDEVVDEDKTITIEWFDSAAEAKGAISELNYTDRNEKNGFVAAVHQKDGKIESIHGAITGQNAISISETKYSYVKLENSTVIPDDYIWISSGADANEGTTLPVNTQGQPDIVTVNSPKYYHVTSGADSGYYELHKDVRVALVIGDNHNNNNILSQGATGLVTNIGLRTLTEEETIVLGPNVKEAYQLYGDADGTEAKIGVPIKIYKDSSLYKVWLGTMNDSMTNMYAWKDGEGNFIYTDKDPLTIAVDASTYRPKTGVGVENEYEDTGLTVGGVDGNKISVDGHDYLFNGSAEPWIVKGSTTEPVNEALCFVYYKTDDTYELVKVDIETFLNENEFKDGLKVVNHQVSVKTHSEGGIDFEYETGESSPSNKALIIKIDNTAANTYYREIQTGEEVPQANRYEYVGIGVQGADAYGYKQSNTGTYVKDTYLYTDSNGLGVDGLVLENKITDNVGKVLSVNGEGFVKQSDGTLKAKVTANDIKVAGDESTKSPSSMVRVKEVETLPQSQDSSAEFLEYRGLIYQWNGSAYQIYEINANTNLNESTAILNYLAYHLDMGVFTISNS